MPIPKRIIEKNLRKKGFVQDNNDHRYFYHEINGKRTGAYAFTSHGSKYKEYDIRLINVLKKELKLNTLKETEDLLKCPMDRTRYEKILKNKGILS
ncbi:hypothetical protein J7K93_13005 [bacterium]|nr:hypothetical protein [bacterium]